MPAFRVPPRCDSRKSVAGKKGENPFDIAVRHWLGNGRLRALLEGWEGDRQAITAVLPAQSRSGSAKVRLFLDHLSELLSTADGR